MPHPSGNVAYKTTTENILNMTPDLVSTNLAEKSYPYWRLRVMYTAIIGYAVFYLVRANFSVAIPIIGQTYGYSKTQLGIVITVFSIVYGIGKFINGYLSDKSNARYFMSIALVGSATVNCFMGFGDSIFFFCVLWGINAWFQSMAWPPIVRLLTHWFSPVELGTRWGIVNSSHQIGGAAIFLLASYLIVNFGWQSAFYIPAIIAFGTAIFLFNRLRDTPHSLGLPSIEEYKGIVKSKQCEEDEHITNRELVRRVLRNKLLWYVCLGNMFLYIVRMGAFTWAPTFLQEMKGSAVIASAWQGAAFEIAGIAGGIIAGIASDRIFKGRRGPVSVVYMIALVFALFYFMYVPEGNQTMLFFAMFALGFLIFGPQVLAGIAAADFASKKAACTANGLTGTFGYLGGAISGVGIGYIADTWGWNGGFLFLAASAAMGAICFSLTWNHRSEVLEAQHKNNKAKKTAARLV